MPEEKAQIVLNFNDNKLLPLLFGEADSTLRKLEEKLGVTTSSRGNSVAIAGNQKEIETAKSILESLYGRLEKGMLLSAVDIDATIRMSSTQKNGGRPKSGIPPRNYQSNLVIRTVKKQIMPYSQTQEEYLRALLENELTFAIGPAGTGKTYLAVAVAVALYLEKKIDRIILSRPAVEAGEKLGFLPGDLKEKVDPYLRPLYDALHDMLPAERVTKSIEGAEIEIAPLAFMRGRTLSHSFIILDEAQNATPVQMKMFLTRIGQGSRMVICGDLSQTDLPPNTKSGLRDAVEKLKYIDEIKMIRFQHQDIVRHELTIKIVEAYEKADKKRRELQAKTKNAE